jgi:hypothetical protein
VIHGDSVVCGTDPLTFTVDPTPVNPPASEASRIGLSNGAQPTSSWLSMSSDGTVTGTIPASFSGTPDGVEVGRLNVVITDATGAVEYGIERVFASTVLQTDPPNPAAVDPHSFDSHYVVPATVGVAFTHQEPTLELLGDINFPDTIGPNQGSCGCILAPVGPGGWYGVGPGLPPGVSMSPSGLFSGTPTTAGAYQFNVAMNWLPQVQVSGYFHASFITASVPAVTPPVTPVTTPPVVTPPVVIPPAAPSVPSAPAVPVNAPSTPVVPAAPSTPVGTLAPAVPVQAPAKAADPVTASVPVATPAPTAPAPVKVTG